MAATIAAFSLTARDNRGRTRALKSFIRYDDATAGQTYVESVTAALAAVAPLSNAAWKSNVSLPGALGYGATAQFDSVVDKAEFVFQDTVGGLHRFLVVAPKLEIFKSDQVTVDPANSLVAAFTAEVLAEWRTEAQVVFSAFIGGVRRTGKLPKRLNIFVLEPGGAYPAE